MRDAWSWIVSDGSLPFRIAAGVLIFATMAIVELRRKGKAAKRWREYAFLLGCVAIAIVYGITNDLVTSRISPEYFLFFKGAAERVSAEAAANPELHRAELDWQAVRIGTLATWTAGLLAGAFLLIANSFGRWPRLSMRRMARYVPIIFAAAIVGGVLLGIVSYRGGLIWMAEFREMVANDEMRPFRVMCTYGIHLGGYIGSLLGLLASIALVIRARHRSRQALVPGEGA